LFLHSKFGLRIARQTYQVHINNITVGIKQESSGKGCILKKVVKYHLPKKVLTQQSISHSRCYANMLYILEMPSMKASSTSSLLIENCVGILNSLN